MTVMGYNDNGIFKIHKEIFKPTNSRKIKVVGRLVKKKDIGIAEKRLSKKNLNLHIWRKFRHFHIMVFVRNAEFIEHKCSITFSIPAVHICKFSLKFACLNAVLLAEIFFHIKSVLFLHNLNKTWVTHKNSPDYFIFIISKMVLL